MSAENISTGNAEPAAAPVTECVRLFGIVLDAVGEGGECGKVRPQDAGEGAKKVIPEGGTKAVLDIVDFFGKEKFVIGMPVATRPVPEFLRPTTRI